MCLRLILILFVGLIAPSTAPPGKVWASAPHLPGKIPGSVLSTLYIPVGNATTGIETDRVQSPLGTVRVIRHGLTVQPPGTTGEPARVRQHVYTHYQLRTNRAQWASIAFHDRSVLDIDQYTDLILRSPTSTYLADGSVHQTIVPGTTHTVITGAAIAGSIGAEYVVRVNRHRTTVTVIQGKVTVSNKVGHVVVKPGQKTSIDVGKPPSKPVSALSRSSPAWAQKLGQPVVGANTLLDANGGSVADSSGSQGDAWSSDFVNDGRLDRGWESDTTTDATITLALGGRTEQALRGIVIDPAATSGAPADSDLKRFSVDASVNSDPAVDGDYVPVYHGVCRQRNTLQTFLFTAPVEARSIRVHLDSNYGNADGISIAEVQVLAVPATRNGGTWSIVASPGFFAVSGVATAPDGSVYVADGVSAVIHLDATGKVVRRWTAQDFQVKGNFAPDHLALTGDGTVYVVDNDTERVYRIDATGVPAGYWPLPAAGTAGAISIGGIAVDGSGNLLLTDSTNGQILKFSASGKILDSWGTAGSGAGEFADPLGIAIDGQGNIFVADSENHRIQELSPSGQPLEQFGTLGTAFGQFGLPRGVVVDRMGRVWVTDVVLHRVQAFSTAGRVLGVWGQQGSGDPGQLDTPWAIASASDGSLLIADTGNGHLQRLDPTGLSSAR